MRKTLTHWISTYKTSMMTMTICQQSRPMHCNSTTLEYLLDVTNLEALNENNHLRFSMRLSYKDPRNGDQRNSLMSGVEHYGITKYCFRGRKHLQNPTKRLRTILKPRTRHRSKQISISTTNDNCGIS